MFKRKIVVLTFSFISIVFVTFIISKQLNQRQKIFDYYLSSNANGYFDTLLMNAVVPEYCASAPFENNLTQLNIKESQIKSILPYYPLNIEASDAQTTLLVEQDTKKYQLTLPVQVDEYYTVDRITLLAYADGKNFLDQVKLSYSFNQKTGIFISEELFDYFGLDKNTKTMRITAFIDIPITAKYIDQTISTTLENGEETSADYLFYSPTQYQQVEYTFEIQGVISENDDYFSRRNLIVIPYDLSAKIYRMAEKTNIALEEDEEIWQPNTYIVQTTGNMEPDELARILKNYISDFMLFKHDYSFVTEYFKRKIYD